jgi:hypothetical protein
MYSASDGKMLCILDELSVSHFGSHLVSMQEIHWGEPRATHNMVVMRKIFNHFPGISACHAVILLSYYSLTRLSLNFQFVLTT